jgi:hypothetical protein
MKIISKNIGSIVLTLAFAGLMTATLSYAGMWGGGSGRSSGAGMNSTNERDIDRKEMTDKSDSQRMDKGDARKAIGTMPKISTGGLGSGDMTMDVNPVKYKNGRLEFKYYANTHSVSLGKYDLMELSTLEVEGEVYKPVKADRMSGHHSGGKIIFEVPEEPANFSIIIRDIPKVEVRTYEWN